MRRGRRERSGEEEPRRGCAEQSGVKAEEYEGGKKDIWSEDGNVAQSPSHETNRRVIVGVERFREFPGCENASV